MPKKVVEMNLQQVQALIERERIRLDIIQNNYAMLQQRLAELNAAIDSLNAVKNAKKEEKILVSLGAGIFLDAKVSDNKNARKLLANTLLIKSIPSLIKDLQDAKDEINRNIKRLSEDRQRAMHNITQLTNLIAAAQKQIQSQQKKE